MTEHKTTWLFPREHGAWGILLVPYLTAVAIAGGWTLPVLVGLAAVLLVFLARAPLELLFVPQSRGRPPGLTQQNVRRFALLYGLSAVACGGLLVLIWEFYLLLALAALAALLFGVRVRAAWRGTERSWRAELAATSGLTLSALAGWVVSTGGISKTGILVWLLNWVFFASAMLYVKSRIRAQMAQHRREVNDPSGFVVAFHLAVMLFVVALVSFRWASPLVAVPFALAAMRAGWALRLRPDFPTKAGTDGDGSNGAQRLSLRRLGWSEVALSLLFAGFLTLGFRL